jgi:hypothetical protein
VMLADDHFALLPVIRVLRISQLAYVTLPNQEILNARASRFEAEKALRQRPGDAE